MAGVEFAPAAEADFDAIADYIARADPAAAAKLIARMKRMAALIASRPRRATRGLVRGAQVVPDRELHPVLPYRRRRHRGCACSPADETLTRSFVQRATDLPLSGWITPVLRALLLAALCLSLSAGKLRAAARDRLTIGISQFPATLHPNIEAMAAKSYVHGMTQRPFTTYDAEWQLACMLCTELPTIRERACRDRAAGRRQRRAWRSPTRSSPGRTWGDGVPVTTDDVLFT